MHPDEIEEMEYAAFAHSDYLREAYGPTARDADRFYDWGDVEPFVGPRSARYCSHTIACVTALLVCFGYFDEIPF
jgi:hypothetical protein